jgi:predicted transcriptional regulator
MSDKQLALDAISTLPEGATIREILDKIEFLAAIQKGLEQVERGETVPHSEVKRQLAQWLSQ